MRTGRFVFQGDMAAFFFLSIFWIIGTAITFGILWPAWFYWTVRYFIRNTSFEFDAASEARAAAPQLRAE